VDKLRVRRFSERGLGGLVGLLVLCANSALGDITITFVSGGAATCVFGVALGPSCGGSGCFGMALPRIYN